MNELGLDEDQEQALRSLAGTSDGLVLAVGPTGSGKSSLLYALLNEMPAEGRNIMTVEPFLERVIPHVSQVQADASLGLPVSAGIRHAAMQEADVIMAKMDDCESAEMLARNALDGRLVLSSLHVGDTVSAVLRMLDMGVPASVVAAALRCVVACRLVRKICPACRETYEPSAWEREMLCGYTGDEVSGSLWHGKGCPECWDTGYKGASGVYETLIVNDDLRRLIVKCTGVEELRESALKGGMRPLAAQGVRSVLAGVTTVQEFTRVLL